MEFISDFIRLHNQNIEGALYKIGDTVHYYHSYSGHGVGVVQAVNSTGDGIEYVIDSCPWLIWEDEITEKLCVNQNE